MIRILVIDDEPDFNSLMVEHFTRMGCAVDTAETGELGFEKIRVKRPDIVIVDNRLPGISGIEVVKRLRAEHKHLFIVMVTVDKEEEVMAVLGPIRVDRYVKKPFRLDVLNDAVVALVAGAKKGQRTEVLDET
ncbi:MAG: response regulator [Candidatus Omnitrophica bacterium]|nr:response regulator [Candidatus Omnitrophota bacterium]